MPANFAERPGIEVAEELGSDPELGLKPAEAAVRLSSVGFNELPPPHRERLAGRLFRQVREPMALLLIGAALVAGLGLGERIDMVAILAIVLLNSVIGMVQEGKSARALEALRTMQSPMSRVRRDGAVSIVPARELVPGDLVLLAAGDRVAADLRLMSTSSLEIDESLLTGESLPVPKDPSPVPPGSAAPEHTSMAFSGTLVTRGSGEGVAAATGAQTQLGAIALRLREPEAATPLQEELARLTGRLGVVSVAIAAGVFGLIVVRTGFGHMSLQRAFLAAVALAVAAVPEGLATVVTVALALGVRRMAARGAIVRRLPAVETLGSTTAILTDKTGTLTENRMRVDSVVLPTLAGEGHGEDTATTWLPDTSAEVSDPAARVAALCNDASLNPPSGDPLEIALLEWLGPDRATSIRSAAPRLDASPFDSATRRMLTLNQAGADLLVLAKGAPEVIVGASDSIVTGAGGIAPLGSADRDHVLSLADALAAGGARVLALAWRTISIEPDDLDRAARNLTLIGLVALRDPVRPEAAEAISQARRAGIRTVMVTGDHAGTAAAVARTVGLAGPDDHVITGADLSAGGPPDDGAAMPVYARVDPDQKLLLVEHLQAEGEVVAVTGDGVNDAPALRRADIGVAMGRSGSDVAREAADMVITDDNLATIVEAVREGRGIFDDIRKVVDYLIAGNLSEIMVVIGCLLLFPALGVPLLPLQLLWINLLTDGLPALALGVDPPDPSLMEHPPRRRGFRLLSGRRLALLTERALFIATAAVGSLALARFLWKEPWGHARGVMFTVLVIAHLLYAFAARRPSKGVWSNRWLLVAVGGGIFLQLMAVGWGPARLLFETAPLTLREWLLVAVAGTVPVLAMFFRRPAR